MRQRVGSQLGLGAVLTHHLIVSGGAAFGHAGVGQVGQLVKQLFLGFFHLRQFSGGGLGVLLELGGAGFEGFGPSFVARFHQAADLAGQVVGFGLGGVVAGLKGAAALVEVEDGGHVGGAGGVAFFGEAGQYEVGLVAEYGKLQHGRRMGNGAKVAIKRPAAPAFQRRWPGGRNLFPLARCLNPSRAASDLAVCP